MGLIIFYGIVSLLPLFFLYQIYRDVARKRARRKQLTRHFKISGAGNGNLRVAEKFVDDLDSIFPWVSRGAIKRIAKNETQGIQTIVTILDLPFYSSWIKGYVLTKNDFDGMLIVDLYPFILEALAGIGRLSIGKLKGVLLHPNLNVRLSAIAALGKTNDPSAVDLLVPILDSTDVEERISAIVALGELRAKSATEKVVASLKDGNPVAREKGVYALMKINDPSALPALEYMARTDRTLVYDRPMQTLADLAEIAIKKMRKTNSQ